MRTEELLARIASQQPADDGEYITRCPKCSGQLEVTAFQFYGKIPMSPYGFATTDAKDWSSEDEKVACSQCGLDWYGLPQGRGWFLTFTVHRLLHIPGSKIAAPAIRIEADAIWDVGDFTANNFDSELTVFVDLIFYSDGQQPEQLINVAEEVANTIRTPSVLGSRIVDLATDAGLQAANQRAMEALEWFASNKGEHDD